MLKITDITDPIDSTRAAKIVGCVRSRIHQLLRAGRIAGVRWGKEWVISRESAEAFRDSDRRSGNPNWVRKNGKRRRSRAK